MVSACFGGENFNLKRALIIFVRNAVLGKVKTRLAKTAGDEKALAVYKELLSHTYSITKELTIDKFIFYADKINSNDIWTENYYKQLQRGVDLGEKMKNAFAHLFDAGYDEICIIGSDCYELTTNIIEQAFVSLEQHDIVLGPATDGGYYLLGLKKLQASLFENINWSTDKVLMQTLNACLADNLSYHLLQTLHDIDEEQDWLQYQQTK